MKCAFPPELEEKSLWTYVDKEADQDIAHHLAGCEYCRERATALSRLRDEVKSRVYRTSCPPALELGDYFLHLLPANQSLVVAQHVRECRHCAQELATLEKYLAQPVSEDNVMGVITTLIARLVSGESSPAFAGLRGEDDEPFIYQADNVQVVIEVQDDIEQMSRKILLGLVTGLESNKFTIQVSQEGQVIATSSVDEIGNFVISHLIPGHYQLILSGANIEIHIQSLSVK